MTARPLAYARFLLPIFLVVTTSVLTFASAGAKAPPATKKTSYAVFYTDSTADGGSNASPCTSKGCANGISFSWGAETCYHGDRYLPVAVIWTVAGKVSTTEWPLNAPCSTGLQFTWDKNNHLNGAKWLGAGSEAKEGLAVCFQSKKECNAGHCVTAGCLPGKTTGVDLFFQGGDSPTAAEWLFNGKPDGAISLSGSPDDVFWYASTPPASPYADPASSSGSSTPSVTITGRNSSGKPQIFTLGAPGSANGIDMNWYLAKYESGPTKGCHEINGEWFPSPPFAFAYTTNGVLSSAVTMAQCGMQGGNVLPFSDINFSWGEGASGPVLTAAQPLHYYAPDPLCQGSFRGTGEYPTATMPQPPEGANGIILTFAHDDYAATCWTRDGSVLSVLKHPGHARFDKFTG